MSRNLFDDIFLARGLKGLLSPPEMDNAVPKSGSILGGFDYRKPFEEAGPEKVLFAADRSFTPPAGAPPMSTNDIWQARALSVAFAPKPPNQLAAETNTPKNPANDNSPPGTARHEACTEAGYECVDAALNSHERQMCWAAEKSCNIAADAMKNKDGNAIFYERFPHGRTVVIPAGGQPRLGPMTPVRR